MTKTTTTTTIESANLSDTLQALRSAGNSIGVASAKIGKLARRLFALFADCKTAEDREKFNAELQVVYSALCKDAQRIVVNNSKQCALNGRTDAASPFQRDGRYVAYSSAKGTFTLTWQDVPESAQNPGPAESAQNPGPAESAQGAESAQDAARVRASIERPLKTKVAELEAKLGKTQHALDTARSERDAAKAEAARLRQELNVAHKALSKAVARAESAERTLSTLKAKPVAVAV